MKENAKDKKKYKGARNRKWQPKDKSTDKEAPKTNDLSGHNDFNWYNLNKELVEMSARIPFGRPLGNTVTMGIHLWNGGTQAWTNSHTKNPIPGICTLYMVPSVGCAVDGTQTIDVASKSMYSFVRHANSGHSNYDSPDLTIYLLAAREIYAAAGYLLKIYGTINKYDATNRYYPDVVLETLRVDPTFARENIAQIRYYCAQFFRKAASIYTPKSLPLFQKAFWMYTQIYEDDKTGKSGLYQYAPSGFHKYNPTKYTTGGCLEWVGVPNFTNLSQFTAYFDALLDPIISDEDMGIMSGDVKKAFGDNIWSLGEFPYDFIIQPVHDSFVLQQMHNARPMGLDKTDTKSLDIVQDNSVNEILFFPCTKFTSGTSDYIVTDFRGDGHLIDIDSAVPTPEEVIEATQYINSYHQMVAGQNGTRIPQFISITGVSYPNNSTLVVTNAGDFICDNAAIHTITANGSFSSSTYNNRMLSITSSSLTILVTYGNLSRSATFAWAPIYKMSDNTPFIGDLHNYTVVETATIDNLHDTTWLSLLAIPAQAHLK